MIFVDTSAWLALADAKDRVHPRAVGFQRRLMEGEYGKMVTTNYVVAETVTITRRRLGVGPAIAFANEVRGGGEIQVFWIEPVHHHEAVDLMAAHEDKNWSLTDCTSFVVMRALGMRDAFAFDQDFVQAGFSVQPT